MALDLQVTGGGRGAKAGATSGEIPTVRGVDLNLQAQTVRLSGSTKTDARTAALTGWGAVQLR
ncbi:MAG: hypothetical protein WCI50_12600, partial [Actinomycetes bacterium]